MPPESESGLSLHDIFRMLAAHRWFILACGLVCLAGSAFYVYHQKPVYEATATLRIDQGRASSLGLSDLLATPSGDPSDAIHTEIAIIKSDGVAIRALDALSADQFRRLTGLSKGESGIPQDTGVLDEQQQQALDHFKAGIGVKQQEGTQLIDISFQNTDPRAAAAVVNNLVSAYTVQNFRSRDASVTQLRTWLSAQMASLKGQVQSSQDQLASFQQANNIIGTADQSNTTTDRLKLLNDALTAAQSVRISKEAQVRAATTGNPGALASLYPNPKLQSLQAEQGTLYAQYAQLSTKFGLKYAPLVELKKQMQAIDGEINNEAQTVRSQLQQEYATALSNQNMLQDEYDEQKKAAYAFNRNQANYAVLQAEVASSRELYDTLQRKLQQAGVDALINGVNTTLVDSARSPLRPIAPKKTLTMVSGVILWLFSGIATAILVEATSDKLQNFATIERVTGFRILATMPSELRGRRATFKLGDGEVSSSIVTLRSPLSRDAEAYRTLRNALLSQGNGTMKTILFTSALPSESVSQAAANLAVNLAQMGLRVLIVDADLRQPSIHEVFGVQNDVGLGNYLLSEGPDRELIQPLKSEKNLCLLVAGKRPTLPAEFLASEAFRNRIRNWTRTFDYIVLKSAPLLVVSDAVPLADWVDATVLVAHYESTHLEELKNVRKLLAHTNAQIAGLLIEGVPIASGAFGSYPVQGKGYYA